MHYNHPIPDAPVAPSMLPRVAAADLGRVRHAVVGGRP
jgi:hypothetical protein